MLLPGEAEVVEIDDDDSDVISLATTEPFETDDEGFEDLPFHWPSPVCVILYHVDDSHLASTFIDEHTDPHLLHQWIIGNAHIDTLL